MYFVVAFLLPFSFSRPYATICSPIFIFYLSSFILCFSFHLLSLYFYLAFCTQPTDSPDEDVVVRERIGVS